MPFCFHSHSYKNNRVILATSHLSKEQYFAWQNMEFLCSILLSTMLFSTYSAWKHDRQAFHLQPFDAAANKTSGAYHPGVAPPLANQRGKTRTRRISYKSIAPEISLEGGEAKEPSQTDDVVFDAGEDERLLEYEDDYRVLKKEYSTVEWTQMKSNESGEQESDEEDSGCWWIFCFFSRQSTFMMIFFVISTLFWCYSGMII